MDEYTGKALTRPLTELSAEINEAHDLAQRAASAALEHARLSGELLLQAKSQVEHGQWLTWLTENCKVSHRQSQRYMMIAKRWEVLTKNDAVSYLTINEACKPDSKSDWSKRITALPTGRLLFCKLDFGYAVVFHSKAHPGFYHFYSYLLETEDPAAEESRKPMKASGLSHMLAGIGWDEATFTEHDDDGNHEVSESTLGRKRPDKYFFQRLGGAA